MNGSRETETVKEKNVNKKNQSEVMEKMEREREKTFGKNCKKKQEFKSNESVSIVCLLFLLFFFLSLFS